MGDISIDDVVSNSKIFNDVASEYEMPGKLLKTNCNISMPSVKPSRSDGIKCVILAIKKMFVCIK